MKFKNNLIQTIFLKGTSFLKGNIQFESGKEKVVISKNSELEGIVTGGTIESGKKF